MTSQPSFFILDAVTPDGRDGLIGMVATTRAAWWTTEFGRQYSGRKDTWGQETFSGAGAPVSLAYQHPKGATPGAWHVLTTDGRVITTGVTVRQLVGVNGPMRRVRWPSGQGVKR